MHGPSGLTSLIKLIDKEFILATADETVRKAERQLATVAYRVIHINDFRARKHKTSYQGSPSSINFNYSFLTAWERNQVPASSSKWGIHFTVVGRL